MYVCMYIYIRIHLAAGLLLDHVGDVTNARGFGDLIENLDALALFRRVVDRRLYAPASIKIIIIIIIIIKSNDNKKISGKVMTK
jgi:hypothetical protein